MDPVILHCDMNNFYASVEILDFPELVDKPVAVCGNPENRHGIILAKNQIAKVKGVVTAETIYSAKKKCPDLLLLPPHREKYTYYSKKINDIYYEFTDLVEPFSIDESWLDVTKSEALLGSGEQIANEIRSRVKKKLGLTLSVGVSYNKIFAKMGSEYKKPDATTIITRENYKDILWGMDVRDMFFVGKATEIKLNKVGIFTIGDLAKTDKAILKGMLGKQGEKLYEYTNGLDMSPVLKNSERQNIKSLGHGLTFKHDIKTPEELRIAVRALATAVSERIRRHGIKAGGVKVEIKDSKFKVYSKQRKLFVPTAGTDEIYKQALMLVEEWWEQGKAIRLLTITAINISEGVGPEQLSIFSETDEDKKRAEAIDSAIDTIKSKFGRNSITYGSILKNDLGIEVETHDVWDE